MADFDTIIIGGGIIGGSALYHLSTLGYPGRTLVLEREDALSKGSTALSAGGFRNIWTTEINMRLTTYSIPKLKGFREELGFPIGFDQRGYLFCQYGDNFDEAKTYGEKWAANGVRIEFLSPEEVEKKVPGLRTSVDHIDPEVNEILGMKPIVGGVFGPDCGAFDPSAAAQAYFERGLEGLNGRAVLQLNREVDRLLIEDGVCRGVLLMNGSRLECETLLLAAGAWSNQLMERSGLSGGQLPPVVPLKRMMFITNFPPIEGFDRVPMTIVDNGIYFRPEGPNLLIGRADPNTEPGFDITPDSQYYEEKINYYLQERIPGMERCRLVSMWGGLYDTNIADHNAVIGFHPEVKGLILATGFSGHGAMEAPAAGLSLAELIRFGEYKTLDCTPLSLARFKAGKEIHETIVI
ncbi:MAG TPA: FAD-binding oxidoreductase [Thermoanaerobaculia bacterium]|nr:FAD-binding oxidoreductase [Thermoanaerobaculia bacterium]